MSESETVWLPCEIHRMKIRAATEAIEGTTSHREMILRRLGGALEHVVRHGETLSTIARRHEMKWRELYRHPFNGPLRRARRNPNRIRPGDVVYIPKQS